MNQILKQYEDALKITTLDRKARAVLKKPLGVVVSDTETTGLLFHTPSYFKDEEKWVDNPFPFGISLAFNYKGRMLLVWGRWGTPLYAECKRILGLPRMNIWHNMKYDLRVCKTNGIEVIGPQHCTLTMSRIYWDRRKRHDLQSLSEFICPEISDWDVDLKKELKKLKSQWTRRLNKEGNVFDNGVPNDAFVNYSFLPDEMIGHYSMVDSFMVYVLYKKLAPVISREYRGLYLRERRVVYVVMGIEETGMGFDAKRGREEIEKNGPKIVRQKRIVDKLGFESQEDFTLFHLKVRNALLWHGVTKKQLTEKGKLTTEADVLRRCLSEGVPKKAERFIKSLMGYRALTKVTNTYLRPLTEMAERTGGIVYTTINPTNTRTGRPASTGPNLLNIPNPMTTKSRTENDVRGCFVPREGNVIYYFDVAQQEYAVLLLYCGEMDMLNAYIGGADIHQTMADKLGRDRKRTKNCNFGVTYGLSVKGMAKLYGLTLEQAKDDMKLYRETFPFVQKFQDRCKRELYKKGYVEDFFGRRYHIAPSQSYKAVNALVQGGCAQAFKIGLLQVDGLLYEFPHAGEIILPVYDEIQIERHSQIRMDIEQDFCHQIISCMTDIPQLRDRGLELRVDVEKTTTNWAEKVKVDV